MKLPGRCLLWIPTLLILVAFPAAASSSADTDGTQTVHDAKSAFEALKSFEAAARIKCANNLSNG